MKKSQIDRQALNNLVKLINDGHFVVHIVISNYGKVPCQHAAITTDGRVVFFDTKSDVFARAFPIFFESLDDKDLTVVAVDGSSSFKFSTFIEKDTI